MCLCSLSAGEDVNASGVGYKVFVRASDPNAFQGVWFCRSPDLRENVEYESASSPVLLTAGSPMIESNTYTSGFHIFDEKNDAEVYLFDGGHGLANICCVKKVKWRQQIVRGKEIGIGGVVVSKYMTILPDSLWSRVGRAIVQVIKDYFRLLSSSTDL